MRKYLIVAIIVALVVLVGLIAITPDYSKEGTAIKFLTNSSLNDGDAVKFQLIDSKGNAIANENVSISLDKNGTIENYSVTTDSNGTGSLVLSDFDEGSYKINVTYKGSNKYDPSSAIQALIISGNTSNQGDTSYGSQTSSYDYSYDSDTAAYDEGSYGYNYEYDAGYDGYYY